MTNAAQSGRFRIGGKFEVNRLGFGAMRIVGKGIWGPPEDRAEAIRTLKRLPELGVDFIDTADSYGPDFSESLIREALHPYGDDQDRDQGRPRPHRPERLDPARPARIPDPAGLQEPLAARGRVDRPVAAPPHRSEGSGRRAVRRDQDADQRRRHPHGRAVGSRASTEIEAASKVFPVATVQNQLQSRRPEKRGRARLLRRSRASASFPGSRSTRASWPAKARSSTPSPTSTRRAPARSRSPGS